MLFKLVEQTSGPWKGRVWRSEEMTQQEADARNEKIGVVKWELAADPEPINTETKKMTIREINLTHATADRSAMAHLEIDGMEYMLLGGKSSVTVMSGRWCHDRRALGKTFHNPAALQSNYRRHGEELIRYANRITNWGQM